MADRKLERRGLGRGLSALMADMGEPERPGEATAPRRADGRIPVDRIVPNPDQPRRSFHAESLEDLAASIREKGIIQPLILRRLPDDPDRYQIVAGERRWRAAQIAQLHDVPAIVRDLSESEMLEVAIIENIQRSDLNAIDEAMGYRQLMDRFQHTQEDLAKALGKSRSHIANLLRLMNLPTEVQAMVAEGKLSSGHARALVTTDNPVFLARQVVARGLSVRETERLAKKPHAEKSGRRSPAREKEASTRTLERELAAHLGLRVSIDHPTGAQAGRITIGYDRLEQLDDICRRLSGSEDSLL